VTKMNLIKLDYEIDAFLAYTQVKSNDTILLESSFRVSDTGDNSIILFKPQMVVKYEDGVTYIEKDSEKTRIDKSVLDVLDELIKDKKPLGTGLVFDGGFAGYLTYDFGMEIMKVKMENRQTVRIPDVYFGYYEDFIVIDHVNKTTYINTKDNEIVEKIKECKGKEYVENEVKGITLNSFFTKEEFEDRVEKVRDYIKKGDVYQVNITQQFYGLGEINPHDIYARVRKANYGPYNAFLDINGSYILSTSPEQFLRKRGSYITTRPIKGTVKRSSDKEENEKLKEILYNSEKTRSELLMIIDLERNDLSRICVPGTVEVEKLFEVEEYATVNHLVSTIKGKMLESLTFGDIIRGTFPGGSITGAPKLRSMEVIEELENVARSIYTGSIGYISNNGNFDLNIAIRTPVITNEGVFYNVGGGMVWDSDPTDEYEETLHKGRALYKALTGKDEQIGY
jgi:para-aminobenzoate synthetase component I